MYIIKSAQTMLATGDQQAQFGEEAFELKLMEVERLVESYGFEHPRTRQSVVLLKAVAEGEEDRDELVRVLLERYGES